MTELPVFVGIDVGGTNIKFGLVDDNGQVLAEASIRTESERGAGDAVQRMAGEVHKLLDAAGIPAARIVGLGLATPGTMDLKAGMLLSPPNLPAWSNFPIRERLAEACDLPVYFANDATAAGFGEYWVGSGRGYASMVLLTLGTGIGAGIIIEGRTIDGEHSHGSECGHILIDIGPEARVCSCGQPGHLEAYASAKALTKRATERLAAEPDSSVNARIAAGEALTPLLLAEEAERGDLLAKALVMEVARYLGIGIVTIVHTIDPAAVILGGAMTFGAGNSDLGREFLGAIQSEFATRAFPFLVGRTVIDFAALGGDAGYIGAAGMARRHFGQHRTQ